MGRHLVPLLPLVDLNDLLSVDGKSLVGVDHHAEQPGVSLDENISKHDYKIVLATHIDEA